MDRKEERKALKHNFLDKIIIRYDYEGLTDYDLETFSSEFRNFSRRNKFSGFKQGIQKQFEVQIKNSINLDPENIIQRQVGEQKIFTFEKANIKLSVASTFAWVAIEKGKYIPFDEYNDYISEIVKKLNEKYSITIKRYGIRKSNILFLKDIKNIQNYFKYQYFPFMKDNSMIKIFNIQDSIKFPNPNSDFNYQRIINQCLYRNEIGYQIKLDMDIYLQDKAKNINNILGNKKISEELNTKLFEVYKDTLTPSFFEALKQEEFQDTQLIGVEKNVLS